MEISNVKNRTTFKVSLTSQEKERLTKALLVVKHHPAVLFEDLTEEEEEDLFEFIDIIVNI